MEIDFKLIYIKLPIVFIASCGRKVLKTVGHYQQIIVCGKASSNGHDFN